MGPRNTDRYDHRVFFPSLYQLLTCSRFSCSGVPATPPGMSDFGRFWKVVAWFN
jgi:hypothetical protein